MTATQVVKHVEKKYPGIKIVDAVKPFNVDLTKSDQKASKRKDPSGCALSKACVRQEELVDAFVLPSTAILVHRVTRRGKESLLGVRYNIWKRTRDAIDQFDRIGTFPEGTYRFGAVAPSNTFKQSERRSEYAPQADRPKTKTRKKPVATPGIRVLAVS